MEALAYAHSYASYEWESGIELDLPENLWDWQALPNSTWSNLLAVAVFVAMLSSTEVALSNSETDSPDDDMLRGLTDPNIESEPSRENLPVMPESRDWDAETTPEEESAPQPQNDTVPAPLDTPASPNNTDSDAGQPKTIDRSPTVPQEQDNPVRPNLEEATPQPSPSPSPEAVQPQPSPSPSPEAVQPQPSPSPSPEVAQPQPSPSPSPEVTQPSASPSPRTQESPQTAEEDYFYLGVNFALEAAQQTQTAKTQAQWEAVVEKWQQAIAAMKAVPSNSRDYNLAQQKITQYQSNLSYAQRQASPKAATQPQPSPSPSPQATQPQPSPTSTPSPSPSPEATQSQPSPSPSPRTQESPQTAEEDYFYLGVNFALEAAQQTQTAKTQAQWEAVVEKWQQAIAAMKAVPSNSRDYNLAQQKITQYQSNLTYAQTQAQPAPQPSPSPSPQATQPQPSPTSTPSPSPSPEAAKPPASPSPQTRDSPQTAEEDYFYLGVNFALEAAQQTQTAKTQAQWEAVVEKWQQAIAAMQAVPSNSRDYRLAQQKITQYQSNLSYAQRQASPKAATQPQPSPSPSPQAAQPQPSPSPSPQAQESPQNFAPDYFYDGLNRALAAAQATQTAKTSEEWDTVAQKWQQAVAAMESVPSDNRDYRLAQRRIREYQSNIEYAQKMPNYFGKGVRYAMEAVELGQTAKTQGQWQEAAQTWQRAIASMESVAPNRPQFAIAQQKVTEYDYYLDTLQGKIQAAIGRMVLKHAIRNSKISPKSVVYSGRGRFFVQNMMYSHTITVYNQQYELIKTISDAVDLSEYGHEEFPGTYRGAPVEAAFSHGGQYGWVSNYQMYGSGFGNPGSDRCSPQAQHDPSFLYRINTDTLNIEEAIKVGSVPKYVAATPDNRFVLATNWCSWDLSVVDVEQNKEIRRIPLGAYPRGIAVDGNSSKAYVAVMGSSNIAIVNLRDFSVRWMKNVGAGPRNLNLSPDNRYLYASLNSEGTVAKIDLRAIDLTKDSNVSGNVAKVRTGSAPRSTVLSADGQFLYVVNYFSNTVSKVRTSDLKVVQSLPTDAHPIGITYDPETRQVWVVCYSGSILIFQD
ncbi:MAG: YncE family protein [Cyanobacteriota bacterium]|nr:YncE family protein [Cyanobacteriota bacterium]